MSNLTEKQADAVLLARKALLRIDDIDLDERSFVVGAIDDAFPRLTSHSAPSPERGGR